MISSEIVNLVVVHHLRGELSNRDMIDAKTFVQLNLQQLPDNFSVLWDLRDAWLMKSDDVYEISLKAFIDPNTPASTQKRAFLVSGDAHHQRVNASLGKIAPPWPWSVHTSYQEALEWLSTPAEG